MRRSLALLKNAHPVQRLLKIEDKSIEKYVKVLGKRHTIRHQTHMEMTKEIKDFNVTTPILEFKKAAVKFRKLEEEIEKKYVMEMKEHLTEPEAEELDKSYEERKNRINSAQYISPLESRVPTLSEALIPSTKPDYEMKDELNPTEEDIGKFFTISKEQAQDWFMTGYFGEYMNTHCKRCDTYDIMLREETLRIINMVKASQNIKPIEHPELSDLSVLGPLEPLQRLGWLINNHPLSYLKLFKKISWLMNDYIYTSKDLKLFNIFRNSADLFESTASIILQELGKSQLFKFFSPISFSDPKSSIAALLEGESLKKIVKAVIDFYTTTITAEEDYLKTISFEAFVEHFSKNWEFTIDGEPVSIYLSQYVEREVRFKYPNALQNEIQHVGGLGCGYVLNGMRGMGKSQVLSGLAAWAAKEQNWVVVRVARGSDFTKNASLYFWEPDAFYMHPEVAYDILLEILKNNQQKLEEIPVDLDIYGKFSLSGFHPEYDKGYEPLPSQHKFLRDEQVWTDEWKEHYDSEILEETFKGVREYVMLKRMTRFEYELKQKSPEAVPDLFLKLLNGDSLIKQLKFKDIFETHILKRKQKKRMLPKSKGDVLKFRVNPKRPDSQDLIIDPNIGEPEESDLARPLKEILPRPSNLKELVELGLKRHVYAVNVLFEVMDQLYRNDKHNVMVLVDEYNEFFSTTFYPSLKYANYRGLGGNIPPYDISLSRLFMRFDGHMIKNGVKIAAFSEKENYYTKTEWVGDPVNIGAQYNFPIGSLSLDDLRKLLHYYLYAGWVHGKYYESDIASIYMLSQGNFGMALDNITYSAEKTY